MTVDIVDIVDVWVGSDYVYRVRVIDRNGRVFNYPPSYSYLAAVLFRSKISVDLNLPYN